MKIATISGLEVSHRPVKHTSNDFNIIKAFFLFFNFGTKNFLLYEMLSLWMLNTETAEDWGRGSPFKRTIAPVKYFGLKLINVLE